MGKSVIKSLAVCIGALVLAISAISPVPSHAATSVQCERLENTVTACAAKKRALKKGKKLSRKAVARCAAKKKKFVRSCATQTVCGQPKFYCPEDQFCAQVMPEPVTYSSLNDAKKAGAQILYYGQCLERGL